MKDRKEGKSVLVRASMSPEHRVDADDVTRESEENSRRAKRVIAVVVFVLVVVTMMVVRGAKKSSLNPLEMAMATNEEKTIEEVEENYEAKLKAARRETLEQHMQLVEVDNDALAVDLVYIDGKKHKHYVEFLLGDNSLNNTATTKGLDDPYPKDSYESSGFDSDYTIEQFEELVRVLDSDNNTKALAISIVQDYYDGFDSLTIPDRQLRQRVKNGLSRSDDEDEDSMDLPSNSSYSKNPSYKKPSDKNSPMASKEAKPSVGEDKNLSIDDQESLANTDMPE